MLTNFKNKQQTTKKRQMYVYVYVSCIHLGKEPTERVWKQEPLKKKLGGWLEEPSITFKADQSESTARWVSKQQVEASAILGPLPLVASHKAVRCSGNLSLRSNQISFICIAKTSPRKVFWAILCFSLSSKILPAFITTKRTVYSELRQTGNASDWNLARWTSNLES